MTFHFGFGLDSVNSVISSVFSTPRSFQVQNSELKPRSFLTHMSETLFLFCVKMTFFKEKKEKEEQTISSWVIRLMHQ